MTTEDITTQVLIEIRNLLQKNNEQIAELKGETAQLRIDLSRRIDQTNKQLLATEIRLATEISALRASVDETNGRLDETNNRLDEVKASVDEVKTSVDDTNNRLDEVKASVDDVKVSVDELKGSSNVIARLERVERDIAELRRANP